MVSDASGGCRLRRAIVVTVNRPTQAMTRPTIPYEMPIGAVSVPDPSESNVETSGARAPLTSAITSSAREP